MPITTMLPTMHFNICLTLSTCPVVMFHDLMVESADPVKRVLPAASVDMQVTAPVWPLKIY